MTERTSRAAASSPPRTPRRLGARGEEYPHRAKYLLLVVDFLRRLLDLHEQLVDDVERITTQEETASLANPRVQKT